MIPVRVLQSQLVGDFKNGGREWRRQGKPEEVRVHDFQDEDLGKVIPLCCLSRNWTGPRERLAYGRKGGLDHGDGETTAVHG